MKKERKVVWVKPNTSFVRCPVRLVEKYLNLLPIGGKKPNLYLQSLRKPKPYCWYSSLPVGINKLRGVVSTMLRDAGLDGYFTNHLLRRTCATRLFQAGQNVKIVKEITGHISDAVHKYQTTSDQQRMGASSVIQGDLKPKKLSEADQMQIVESPNIAPNEKKFSLPKLVFNNSDRIEEKVDEPEKTGEINDLIETAVRAVGNRKAKVTVQVELMD